MQAKKKSQNDSLARQIFGATDLKLGMPTQLDSGSNMGWATPGQTSLSGCIRLRTVHMHAYMFVYPLYRQSTILNHTHICSHTHTLAHTHTLHTHYTHTTHTHTCIYSVLAAYTRHYLANGNIQQLLKCLPDWSFNYLLAVKTISCVCG